MLTHKKHSGNPADAAPQSSAAPSMQLAAQTSESGGSPTMALRELHSHRKVSGIWFREEDPQILIQWSVQEEPHVFPETGCPSHKAQVRIYQEIFGTELPATHLRSSVPFSVTNPATGPSPYLQGSLVFSQFPPRLEVVNLRFPGFQAQHLSLHVDDSKRLGDRDFDTSVALAAEEGIAAPEASRPDPLQRSAEEVEPGGWTRS